MKKMIKFDELNFLNFYYSKFINLLLKKAIKGTKYIFWEFKEILFI